MLLFVLYYQLLLLYHVSRFPQANQYFPKNQQGLEARLFLMVLENLKHQWHQCHLLLREVQAVPEGQ